MIKTIQYDFSDMELAVSDLMECAAHPANRYKLSTAINALKDEINKFFKDSTCEEIIFTNNTDKLFFGMSVMPIIDPDKVYDFVSGTKRIRIKEYYLEIDSKLFTINLTAREIVAIILHEIGHMVNDTKPVDSLRANFGKFLTSTNSKVYMTKNVNYKELLSYGIKDALRKMNSIFEKKDDEILADEFVISYGYGHELESALTKIIKHSHSLNRDVDNKFIVLAWTLRLYMDVKNRRISALRTLKNCKSITPSFLERRELDNAERRLNRIDDDSLISEAVVSPQKAVYTLKRKGLRGYEDDLFEFTMQIRNIQHEDDALMLMHKINSRMSIIDDCITNDELSPQDFKRWSALYDKYVKLRETLSTKTLYKDDYNRIYVSYPEIKDNQNV